MENDKVQPIAYKDDTFSLRLLHAYRRVIDKTNYVKKSWGHFHNLGSVGLNMTPPPASTIYFTGGNAHKMDTFNLFKVFVHINWRLKDYKMQIVI